MAMTTAMAARFVADRGGQQHSARIATGAPPSLIRSKESLQLFAAWPASPGTDGRSERRMRPIGDPDRVMTPPDSNSGDGIQMIKQEIDQHAGDRDVHPDGPADPCDPFVERAIVLESKDDECDRDDGHGHRQ